MTGETILILDFGGQYKELIARRVREHGVYSEIRSCKMPVEEIRAMAPKGIIFTGGPDSVYRDDSPTCDKAVLELGIPVLGICAAERSRRARSASTAYSPLPLTPLSRSFPAAPCLRTCL